MTDKYGWRPATKDEVDKLVVEMDLCRVFHSVTDTSLWYLREEAKNCKSYMDCTPYVQRCDLYETDPTAGYYINQSNVDAWRVR